MPNTEFEQNLLVRDGPLQIESTKLVDSFVEAAMREEIRLRMHKTINPELGQKFFLEYCEYLYWEMAWLDYYRGLVPAGWEDERIILEDILLSRSLNETLGSDLTIACLSHPYPELYFALSKVQRINGRQLGLIITRLDYGETGYENIEQEFTKQELSIAYSHRKRHSLKLIPCLGRDDIPQISCPIPLIPDYSWAVSNNGLVSPEITAPAKRPYRRRT